MDKIVKKGFGEWIKDRCEESKNFKFWSLGLQLLINYFIFVRSFREANYYLYKRALRSWIPWFSVFDHYQYLRYATAHIVDLGIIDSYNSDMSNLLIKGVFTANKTGRRFSNIPTDQNHEQVNKELKSSGGISGLLNTTA